MSVKIVAEKVSLRRDEIFPVRIFETNLTLWNCILCLTGLATKLNEIVLTHCSRRGFKHAMVETTNPAAHHIYTKKLNGRVFTSIYLPTFVMRDGQRPFEHYDAEISLIVFELQ